MGLLIVLKSTVLNMCYLLGGFIGFGFLFNQLEQWNNQLIASTFGKWGIILTGFIGTVVHEGSHFLMCLLFGHRVTEVKWFRPIAGQSDGVLGYVSHTYNRGSWYQTAGNFFIGIAPIIGGTLMMIFLFRWLLPTTYLQVKQSLRLELYTQWGTELNLKLLVQQLLKDVGMILKALFFNREVLSWRYVIFLFSVYSISTHMALSPADLKGSLSGLVVIFGLVFAATAVMSLFGLKLTALAQGVMIYNVFVILFLTVGLVFSLITLGISFTLSRLF